MATPTEKAPTPPQQLHVKTPHVSEKMSHDTLGSGTLTPSAEKNTAGVLDSPRASDVSSPRSNRLNPFDTDIEAMITPSTTNGAMARKTTTNCTKVVGTDCQVWPGRDHWKQKHKAAKMQRSCNCLGSLSRRNRIIVKCAIVLLIVAIAIGVGIGISKPLGAGFWHPPR